MAPFIETLSYEIDNHFWLLKIDFDSFATACDFVLVTLCVYHDRAYSRERPPISVSTSAERKLLPQSVQNILVLLRQAFRIFWDYYRK